MGSTRLALSFVLPLCNSLAAHLGELLLGWEQALAFEPVQFGVALGCFGIERQ